eukprot:evm.model.NODE_3681_length_18997_cov_25.800283.4
MRDIPKANVWREACIQPCFKFPESLPRHSNGGVIKMDNLSPGVDACIGPPCGNCTDADFVK